MKDLINKFFSRQGQSKDAAKQRLKFLLIHDQVDLTAAQLDAMKTEILAVIARYVDIDDGETLMKLERADNHIALISNVPVRRVLSRSA
jgi:cell division topological specificity factor